MAGAAVGDDCSARSCSDTSLSKQKMRLEEVANSTELWSLKSARLPADAIVGAFKSMLRDGDF